MTKNDTQTPILLLTPRQAARALNISEKTLYNYTKAGAIPVVQIGRCKRYTLADLTMCIDRAKSLQQSS